VAFVGLAAGLIRGPAPAGGSAPPEQRSPRAVAAEIDRELEKRLAAEKIAISPPADDAEFLRRAYLDITGRIPTADKATAFLDSKDPDKRHKLIDDLLASPEYGRHFATVWANLITATGDPEAKPSPQPFVDWLAKELNAGRGWDKIVHEMLTASGTAAASPATFFTLANGSQPGQVGSSATQLFLGVRLQCAECHDHPFTKYHQSDYWGMAAFFGRLKGAGGKNKAGNEVVELTTPVKGAKGGKKGPAIAGAAADGAITVPAAGGNKGAGKVMPAKFLDGPSPKLPAEGLLRPTLAAWLTSPDNPYFAPAAANRVWGHFLGYGFVAPLDDFKEGNEPSHPELLQLLAREFTASGYDYRHLIRCICASKAYQRSSKALDGNKDDEALFSHMAVKVMTPAQMYDSLTTALGVSALPGGLGSQPRYGDGKGKNAKGAATARKDGRDEFLKFFNTKEEGAGSSEFTHGIPQLLGLLNGSQFNRVTPAVDKLVDLPREKAVEQLFLGTLSRRPSADELKLLLKYVDKRQHLKEAYSDILWMLFNTAEFVLNH